MNRLRVGEWVAAAGSVGLLVVMFFDWFGASVTQRSGGARPAFSGVQLHVGSATGWSTLGWFMVVLLCVAIFGGLSLSYMTVKRTSPAWPVGAGVLTIAIGALVFLILVIRVLDLAGDTHEGAFTLAVGVRAPGYLGLLFAFVIPLGGFLSLRDERTDSPEARAYTPPPPRPIPGS